MNHIMRPFLSKHYPGPLALAVAAACLAAAPHALRAQGDSVTDFFANPSPLLTHSSQGYLGVDIADVDPEKAQQLKLKDVRGAMITLIDHDAPAGKIGLKVNDVILTVNGQQIEGAEQLRRMLREIPAGRKVSIEISRDGNIQTIAVELADRAAMEHDIWDKIGKGGDDIAQPVPGLGILGDGAGDLPSNSGFHMPFFGSSLKVGALVEPLTSQMAEYLGVNGGLMVKQVARKSEAATAGLHAFDVILKVGSDSISTAADWERALRSNEGKQVQVTILRDKKQQTLNLQVDSKRHSELEWMDVFGDNEPALLAENDAVNSEALEAQAQQNQERAEQLRKQIESQADALRNQIQSQAQGLSEQQAEELRKHAEKMARQAEQMQHNINPDQFKIDPQQMEKMRQQMDQMRQQLERHKQQLQDQMQYWLERQSGHFV